MNPHDAARVRGGEAADVSTLSRAAAETRWCAIYRSRQLMTHGKAQRKVLKTGRLHQQLDAQP